MGRPSGLSVAPVRVLQVVLTGLFGYSLVKAQAAERASHARVCTTAFLHPPGYPLALHTHHAVVMSKSQCRDDYLIRRECRRCRVQMNARI